MTNPDNSELMITMDIKTAKLKSVKKKIIDVLEFLSNYLPLVNCHSNDFILKDHWNKFLPCDIQRELLKLSDTELVDLLCTPAERGEENLYPDCYKESWKFQCDYLKAAKNSNNMSEIYSSDMLDFPPKWIHRNLKSFLRDANSCSLQNSEILSKVSDLEGISDEVKRNDVFISTFMNKKKTHEVEVMGMICSKLADRYNVDMTVDLGSGKGYLSTHLAFQHKLMVLGIDAQNINTAGASKRAGVLSKQWDGLTRNQVLRMKKDDASKLGKKQKKLLKKQRVHVHTSTEKLKTSEEINFDIPDDVLSSFSELFDPSHESMVMQKSREDDVKSKSCMNLKQEHLTNSTFLSSYERTGSEKIKSKKQEVTEGADNRQDHKNTSVDRVTANEDKANLRSRHIPITMFVTSTCNLTEVIQHNVSNRDFKKYDSTALSNMHQNSKLEDMSVDKCFKNLSENTEKECSKPRELRVMLTGLHTCGGLGSNILRLFVNSKEAKLVCNVSCCYHLMTEEFVASPFIEKDHFDDSHGFPMSNFLTKQEVGIGRQARNLASQSVNRRAQDHQVLAKQFPRMLLQVILYDQLGYVKRDWKGLRKLDQKTANMFEYVHCAFTKLGISTENISEELVNSYEQKYKDQEKKFAAFFQLKTALAPCIEAVILLDRLCYLLEQECVRDAHLIQIFEPVTSPRCYGVIAFKNE